MAIKPIDVRRKEFKSGFRGYDANQVDDYLDEVADEFERAFVENQRIREEVTVLRGRLEQFEELEGAIREALVQAQQVARDLRRNANKEAELVVREAKEQAHRILADSSARVERVQESYEVLRKAKQDFANDFRHLLKSYLTVMDNADVASAKEIEASLREHLDTESIAAARQAAETRRIEAVRDEPAPETAAEAGAPETAEDEGATERIEIAQTPTGGTTGPEASEGGSEPEVEEPEVEPSGAQASQEEGREETPRPETSPASEAPEAEGEVDREEPVAAGEGRAYDEFFDEEKSRSGEKAGGGKIFRASRFLRRRG